MRDAVMILPARFVDAEGKKLSYLTYIFLILLCLAFFTPGLMTLPATDRDESLFAQASKQMIESGNYVDIHVQDKSRYKKPIGIYWLQVASVKLLNINHLNEVWAYRMPSLLGAIVAVVMTAAIGTLFFNPLTGFLAALMMVGCVVLNVEARLGKTDAALLASVMVAQYALARAYLGIRRSWSVPLLFWTALGVGILIKGPIILLVLFATLGWLRLTEKNITWFQNLKPLRGTLYLLLLIMPWFVAIAMQSHGQFLQDSAGHDLLDKIMRGQDRGMLPPGVHFLVMPAVFFPFSLFVLLAIPDAWACRQQPAYRFLLGWIIPVWIVFELSLTKLPHYVLPVYPAIAVLAAKALCDGYPVLAEKNMRWLMALTVSVWLMVGMGFALGFALLPYFLDHTWNKSQIIVSILFIISQGITLLYVFQRKTFSVIIACLGSLLFLTCVMGVTLPQVQHLWVTQQIIQIADQVKQCPNIQVASASYDEPSLIFTAGTHTHFSPDGADIAAQMQQEPCVLGVLDKEHRQRFIDAFVEKPRQPLLIGSVDGFNLGAGRKSELTLYIMPPKLP